jgi:hypothetical protein
MRRRSTLSAFHLSADNTCLRVCEGTVYNGIAGSVASASSGSMQLECLPCDERGRPHAAAQDMNGYVWATLLPVTGFPLLLGRSVSWFPVRNHVIT